MQREVSVIEPLIVIVALPDTQILDVTGPLEVFSSATRFVPSAQYRTRLVSAAGGTVVASCGMEFNTQAMSAVETPIDTLIVAGGRDMDEAPFDGGVLSDIQRLADAARRVTSVCSGAFLLAAAGLLDGRRATTHWANGDALQDAYPSVSVDTDAIYVRDGNVWTSAGVTAGIDLALALVADDHGRQAAAPSLATSSSTCGDPVARPSSRRCSPPSRPTANPCETCSRGCPTTWVTTSPSRRWPAGSISLSDSSAGCSGPRSARPRRTTSRPHASNAPADCWKPPRARSSSSRSDPASERQRR
jgi:transcriptional regulator GlxA family with amidase domain